MYKQERQQQNDMFKLQRINVFERQLLHLEQQHTTSQEHILNDANQMLRQGKEIFHQTIQLIQKIQEFIHFNSDQQKHHRHR
jgi:hypothetical protein